jgi:hypothetical protein
VVGLGEEGRSDGQLELASFLPLQHHLASLVNNPHRPSAQHGVHHQFNKSVSIISLRSIRSVHLLGSVSSFRRRRTRGELELRRSRASRSDTSWPAQNSSLGDSTVRGEDTVRLARGAAEQPDQEV